MWIIIAVIILLLFGLANQPGERTFGNALMGLILWILLIVLLISGC